VPPEVLVVGAGPAGLTAGWQAAVRGAKVRVVAKGWGALHWHAGCIDVLGYYPLDGSEPLEAATEGISGLVEDHPHHPYAILGLERVVEAVQRLQDLCELAGYPLQGSLDRNWLLPSAVGARRPTSLAPATMVSGDLRSREPMLIVGFEQLPDFYAALVAANLTAQEVPSRDVTLDLPGLRGRRFTTPPILADLFDHSGFREEVAQALQPKLGKAARVGFPGVLGTQHPLEVRDDLEARLGRPVFEIPTLPPSVPGMRLHRILVQAIESAGGSVFQGMEALSVSTEDGRLLSVNTEAAARHRSHRADAFVLATGGILGGGIAAGQDGALREPVLRLPLVGPAGRAAWFGRGFLDAAGHPVYRAGVRVDAGLRPLDGEGRVIYQNLYAAGGALADAEVLRERSLEGVAVATGYLAGQQAAAESSRAG
jgi:glycerol-3-phosphate dehydrogenase subunit B